MPNQCRHICDKEPHQSSSADSTPGDVMAELEKDVAAHCTLPIGSIFLECCPAGQMSIAPIAPIEESPAVTPIDIPDLDSQRPP